MYNQNLFHSTKQKPRHTGSNNIDVTTESYN